MSVGKSRQRSQSRRTPGHNRNVTAISAAVGADAWCAGGRSLDLDPFIGGARGCRFMSGGAKALGARVR